MSYNKVVLLGPLLDIRIEQLPDLLGRNHSVHPWHINIHDNKPVCLLSHGYPLLTLHDCLLSTYRLIRFYLMINEEHVGQDHNVEHSIVNN